MKFFFNFSATSQFNQMYLKWYKNGLTRPDLLKHL